MTICRSGSDHSRFNSATAFEPWRLGDRAWAGDRHGEASIRPRLLSRGDALGYLFVTETDAGLQFGHGF